jgi:hypothetical protein
MNWNSQESAPLPQANFKMGGFSDSEAGRLNCYKKGNSSACNCALAALRNKDALGISICISQKRQYQSRKRTIDIGVLNVVKLC